MHRLFKFAPSCLGFSFLTILILSACQAPSSESEEKTDEKTPEVQSSVKPGTIGLRLTPPVSEPKACIFPIGIENGLDNPTSVTMIAFKVTGPGEDASGNMFAPAVDPGERSEARVIIQGQSCDAFDTLTIPEVRCTSGEQDCSSKVELIDGGGLKFARPG